MAAADREGKGESQGNLGFLQEIDSLLKVLIEAAEKRGIPPELFKSYLRICVK